MSEVPKIAFNDRVVPHHMPDDIWITDTTFRDGQQSRAPYTYGTDRDDLSIIFTAGQVRKERYVSLNFSCTAKKTEMLFIKCLEKGYEVPGSHQLDPCQ